MSAQSVALVVVAYDSGDDLVECVESAGPVGEVVVVDNASSDGAVERFAAHFPGARVVRHSRNLGFAAGANSGVRASASPYVVVLNPDARAQPDAIGALATFLDGHPSAGVVGGEIRNPDGGVQPSKRTFPPLWAAALHGFVGMFWPRNPGTRRYLDSGRDFSAPARVDWVAANGCAYRREALERVGGFDERFFFFVEDVDLCRRLGDAGYEVWFDPAAAFTHRWGGSWTSRPLRFLFLHNAALFRYVRKHRRGVWIVTYPVVAAALGARFALQVLRLVATRRAVPSYREADG